MIGTIIVTFTLTSLAGLSAFLYYRLRDVKSKNDAIRLDNKKLADQLDSMGRRDSDRQRHMAYERGFNDARETDKLYRETLEKYQLDQRSRVMLYGEKDEIKQRRK